MIYIIIIQYCFTRHVGALVLRHVVDVVVRNRQSAGFQRRGNPRSSPATQNP